MKLFRIDYLHLKSCNRCLAFLFLLIFDFAISMAQPVITGLVPATGPVGSNVTISGTGFNTTAANNKVFFGAVKASVVSAMGNSIIAIVPAGINNMPLTVTNNGLTAYSKLPFGISFPGGGPLHSGSFYPSVDIYAPGFVYGIASADIDGDGKIDIITSNIGNQELSIYRNATTSGSVSFLSPIVIPLGINGNTVAVGDLDGDGKPDVVVSDFSSDSIYIFRNTSVAGSISFETKKSFLITRQANKLVVSDIDLDGKPDIVLASDSHLSVMRNTTSGSNISLAAGTLIPGGKYVIAVTDINENGKPDLISGFGNNVVIIENLSTPGNLQFSGPLNIPVGAEVIAITTGDLNSDGKPDIVSGNYGGPYGTFSILKNTNTGISVSFAAPVGLNPNREIWDLSIIDVDGDTKPDIVFANNNFASIGIYRNTSSAGLSFDPKIEYYTGDKNWRLETADFTNDGRPDIAGLSYNGNYVSILRNKIGDPPTISSFNPLTGGEGSQITINGTNLTTTTSVSFGGVAAASFIVVSDLQVKAFPGASGASGIVSVTTAVGTATLPGFTYTIRPAITSFSSVTGQVGDRVRITGSNFIAGVGNNTVYFGAAKATILEATSTDIDVTVPAGATFLPISVVSGGYNIQTKQPFRVTFANGSLSLSTFIKKFNPAANINSTDNVSIADIDGDGKSDIIVNIHGSVFSGPPNDSFAVYRNTTVNGVVSFAPKVSFKTTGTLTKNTGFADLDADGKLDVIALNDFFTGSGSMDVFRNTSTPGNISFSSPLTIFTGDLTTNVSIADVDGDGKLDLSIAAGNTKVDIYRNSSSGTTISFESPKTFLMDPNSGGSLASWLGDVDGDGKPDLAATAGNSNFFSMFRNTSTPGTINFASRLDFNVGHITDYVTMGDVDGDGKQDVILGSGYYNEGTQNFDSAIIILRNISTPGAFTFDPSIYQITSHPWNIVLCDLDGDGKIDLATSENENGKFSVFRNNSTPGQVSFEPKYTYSTGYIRIQGMDAGDLDGDGKPDLAMAENYSAVMLVYINQNGSDLSICPNGNAIIYANLSGGTYQWQVNTGSGFTNITNNSNYAGTNTATLSLTNVPAAWYGYSYRCLVNSVAGKTTSIRFTNTWTGVVNNSWEVPGNWSCGSVPNSNTNVVINAGTVVVNSNVTIRSLTMNPSVVFTVNPAFNISIIP